MGIGAGLVLWKNTVAKKSNEFASLNKEEIEAFLEGFNPIQLQNIAGNKEEKDRLVNNLKQTLALASEAKKSGVADDKYVKNELDHTKKFILAASYDQKINKGKGPMPPFGFISEDQIKQFWGDDFEGSRLSWIFQGATPRWHDAEFDKFLATKLELARRRGQIPADREPNEQEIAQAKDSYARTMISYYAAKSKLKQVEKSGTPEEQKEWKKFKTKVDVQTRLQKAQFLATTLVREKLAKEMVAKEKEIKDYIAEHPELTKSAEKRNTAKDLLKRVKEGADFAELAKEYSEDPGSKGRGGLYEGVTKGRFAREFEAAVDKLEPGEVAPDIVETPFGFHIIKLEKRGLAKGASGQAQPTYDVRHILISTMVPDPENPAARPKPVDQFVKEKLEKEKQEKALDDILKRNPVELAEDFEIPAPSQEELDRLRRPAQPRPAGPEGPSRPAAEAEKKE